LPGKKAAPGKLFECVPNLGKGEEGGMKKSTGLIWPIVLLLLVSLACAESGEILSPEEATIAAQEESLFQPVEGASIVTSGPQIGEEAIIAGTGLVINLFNEPGGRISAGEARGATVEIIDIAEFEGELWYHVDGAGAAGWVPADNLEAKEPEGEDTGEGEAGDGETAESEGPQTGDQVYLTGVGFMINLLAEPGGFIRAGQEKGTEVTILQVVEFEGDTWYLIDAPTGQGWLPSENITTEAPE
jgi:hypothetical protein